MAPPPPEWPPSTLPPTSPPPSPWQRLLGGHPSLKARIHAFRLPIRNPWLLRAVKLFYLLSPVAVGWLVMERTNAMARASLGERGEKLLEMQRERRRADGGAPAAGGASGRGGAMAQSVLVTAYLRPLRPIPSARSKDIVFS
jgi:hypothetical protein